MSAWIEENVVCAALLSAAHRLTSWNLPIKNQVTSSRKLDRVTVGLVCIAALTIGAVFVRKFEWTSGSPREIVRGTRLPTLTGYKWQSHPRTLVLALRVGCPYCESSMGFYARLLNLERSRALGVHVLAAFPDAEAAITETVSERIPGLATVGNVSLEKFGVAGTPTLILVDNRGEVRDVWTGQLSRLQEEDVIKTIGASANR